MWWYVRSPYGKTAQPSCRPICGYDEIGKHAGFRFQCRKACGFESHYPYHVGASFVSLAPTFSNVRAHSLRCSSSPNRTRFARLRFGFSCSNLQVLYHHRLKIIFQSVFKQGILRNWGMPPVCHGINPKASGPAGSGAFCVFRRNRLYIYTILGVYCSFLRFELFPVI